MKTLLLVIVAALAAPARADEPPARITHGPILGRLGAHEIGVWARTSRAAPFRVKYGTAPDKLDRLSAHIAEARRLLASGEAIGRKLDFLTQEFVREANTLCSKSSSIPLTRTGLELKAAIERLKEQSANVE